MQGSGSYQFFDWAPNYKFCRNATHRHLPLVSPFLTKQLRRPGARVRMGRRRDGTRFRPSSINLPTASVGQNSNASGVPDRRLIPEIAGRQLQNMLLPYPATEHLHPPCPSKTCPPLSSLATETHDSEDEDEEEDVEEGSACAAGGTHCSTSLR